MHNSGRVCFSPLGLSGCVSLRSVFLAVFLEALSLHYSLIQLRDVNFQSSFRYMLSPSFGGFASLS